MSVIENLTFRLAAGSDEGAFLEADRRVQSELVPNLAGFMRRTTARGEDGDWLVVTVWGSNADAEACSRLAAGDPVATAFNAFLDQDTIAIRRYATLD